MLEGVAGLGMGVEGVGAAAVRVASAVGWMMGCPAAGSGARSALTLNSTWGPHANSARLQPHFVLSTRQPLCATCRASTGSPVASASRSPSLKSAGPLPATGARPSMFTVTWTVAGAGAAVVDATAAAAADAGGGADGSVPAWLLLLA